MLIPIPLTKYSVGLTKRGVTVIDRKTHMPIEIDKWLNQFSLGGKTPILENIYDTIASEFSKIDLILAQYTTETLADGREKHSFTRQRESPEYNVLTLRPNMLQGKTELLYTIAYQLHMYRNALVHIIRNDGVVVALEPINCGDYLFGQGYEIAGGLYLKLKEKKTNKMILLDYGDVIHLRLNPNDIFYGDNNDSVDLSNFVKVFDENLNVMFNELKNAGQVSGILELSGGIPGDFNITQVDQDAKINKQKEIIERIKASSGLIVLDSGEKWTSLARAFKTMTGSEIDAMMKYLYNFKGINQAVIDGTATEAQMEVFFNKTIMPIIERFIEELNCKFLTKEARGGGMVIEYFKNPFEYMATKELLSNLYLGAMFFTQNEIRHMAFKLPPLTGGDVLIDNKNFTKGINAARKAGENIIETDDEEI